MGTKGFWSFINNIVKTISLNKLRNKNLLIDINLYLYKHIIGIRKNGKDILNNKGENISHLITVYNIIKNLLLVNITPVFIFDGKAPEIKKQTIEKRKKITNNSQILTDFILEYKEDLEEIVDENIDDIYIKYFKKSFTLNKNIIEDCKHFLTLTGIPFIESKEEADLYCAQLSKKQNLNIAGVLSDDSDILIMGCEKLYKDIDFHNMTITEISITDILKYLQDKANKISKINKLPINNFTFKNLVDFTIILGNDYCSGIRVNNKKAFVDVNKTVLVQSREDIFTQFIKNNCDVNKLIDELYNINNMCDYIMYYIPSNFKQNYDECKKVYYREQYELNDLNLDDINLDIKKVDINQLKRYLTDKNIFNNDNFINMISKIKKNKKKEIKIEDEDGWITV